MDIIYPLIKPVIKLLDTPLHGVIYVSWKQALMSLMTQIPRGAKGIVPDHDGRISMNK